jgi:hypothetical protein
LAYHHKHHKHMVAICLTWRIWGKKNHVLGFTVSLWANIFSFEKHSPIDKKKFQKCEKLVFNFFLKIKKSILGSNM